MTSRRDFLQTAGIAALSGVVTAGCAQPGASPTPKDGPPPTKFDLEVAITGLCVFVPDPSGSKMHVLMVQPAGNHGGGALDEHRHYPRLFHDAAYNGPIPTDRHYWDVLPLEHSVLDLSGLGNGDKGTKLEDIDGLLNITGYTPALADPTSLDIPNLACRVTLPLANEIMSPDPRGQWDLRASDGTTNRQSNLAWEVVWKVNALSQSDLKLSLRPFPETPSVLLAPIHPVQENGKNVIKLFITNAIAKESGPPLDVLPDPPDPGFKMPHFDAFKDLYEGSNGVKAWPELVYAGPGPGPAPGGGRATPYTCLPSGGH